MNSHMKSLVALGAGLILLAGCEKKEATPPAQEPPSAAASQPADMGAMMQETQKAASNIATATTNAVTNLQQEVTNAAAKAQEVSTQALDVIKKETNSLTDKTNTVSSITDGAAKIIEAARKLTGENKYDEALKMLGTLANSKLTPDQQKMVDSLKEQIQKAMAAKATESATKAVGDLFKK